MTGLKAFENAESLQSADIREPRFTQHSLIGSPSASPHTYNAIGARLFGLSFANYLRYARDEYNATIMGRQGYSYLVFKNSKDCDNFVKELNRRWNIVMVEREKRGFTDKEESI